MNILNSMLRLPQIQKTAIEWNRHALERMLERGISRQEVTDVLFSGEVIEDYPSDRPYPSFLMYGTSNDKSLHVVLAFDQEHETVYIITAYFPDTLHFLDDYRTRRV